MSVDFTTQAAPRFSVVIPTYNRAALVEQAVESVMRQTVPAYEIIVVVDGSKDATVETLRSKFPSIKVLDCVNRGLALTRNRGLAEVTGDWVGYLDDDDLWHPQKLEFAARYIAENPGCEALNNPHWYFSAVESGPSERIGNHRDFAAVDLETCVAQAESRGLRDDAGALRLSTKGQSYRAYLRRDRGVISSILVKRELLIRVGGSSPSQVCNEDWTLFLNVTRLAEWHTLPFKLGFTRFHENQMTNPEPTEMLFSLANWINAWFGGRPAPEKMTLDESIKLLKSYGPVYRNAVAAFHWYALKNRKWTLARQIRVAGRILLPSFGDRMFAWMPPPITWRIERLLSNFKRTRPSTPAEAVTCAA